MATPLRCLLLCLALFSLSQPQTAAAGRDQSQVVLQEQISKQVAQERSRNRAAKIAASSVREICLRGRPKAAC